MPFIDDALLWCPDNDGRIVGGLDIATCIQDEVNESNENVSESTQLAESTTAELNALEPSLCNNDSSDELFRQLTESNFEIESLLSDLATVEVKEENNNISDVTSDVVVRNQHDAFAALVNASGGVGGVVSGMVNGGGNVTTCSSNIISGKAIQLPGENSALGSVGTNSLTLEPTAASSTQEQANCSSFLNQNTNNNNNSNSNLSNSNNENTTIFDDSSARYLIATNPLLAEKLMSKSLILNKNDKTIGDFKDSEDENLIFNAELCKRAKRKHDPVSKTRKENAVRRMKGKQYFGFSTSDKSYERNSKKEARTIGLTCSSKFCEKSSFRNCKHFDNETRDTIFKTFWEMGWEAKKVFVRSYVKKESCSINRVKCSRRQNSFTYFLPHKHRSLQVCRFMFLSTLSINIDMVKGWLKLTRRYTRENHVLSLKEKRAATTFHLNKYFQTLDKVESHYSRKDTSKIYIAASFKTKVKVFNDYCNYCLQKGIKPVSIFTFSKLSEENKLALFLPRKDQCDICVGFGVNQVSIDDFDKHILKKNQAQNEKTLDKIKAKDGKCHVFTMDTQAVKLCPNLNASAVYFKQRLQVHNFTIYNLDTHQCTNYWNEVNGDISASVFITCIIHHLKKHCLSDSLPIIIYSDGCGYQNRNHYLSNALSLFALENDKVIEQKYLEKGHTQMECDSVHAKIEIKLKNQLIYLPNDYARITKEARKTVTINGEIKKKPFDVEYSSYDFFRNYSDEKLIRFSSIRPGRIKNDRTVSDLRSILYLSNGSVKYKVNYDDDYVNLLSRTKPYVGHLEPKPLFSGPLAIQSNKWKCLQDLKNVMPHEYHSFYDNLNHTALKK